jgi:hypothetical protein
MRDPKDLKILRVFGSQGKYYWHTGKA